MSAAARGAAAALAALVAAGLSGLSACGGTRPGSAPPPMRAGHPADVREAFDTVPVGGLPSGWQPAETNATGTPAVWAVARDDATDGGNRVLRVRAQNRGSTFNLLLSPRQHGPDVDLAVRLRPLGGSEDRGGGLLWGASGSDDYQVARWNPLENSLCLYQVISGKRTPLANADVHVTPDGWHELSVSVRGADVRVSLDGRELLQHRRDASSGAGKVGLWTKADASTDFDAVVVTSPPR